MIPLADLRRRVEAATGRDRELDALIWCACMEPRADGWKPWPGNGGYVLTPTGEKPSAGMGQFVRVPDLTASLDAIVALIERVLPGAKWSAESSLLNTALVWEVRWAHPASEGHTPPLALLAALLAALEAKEMIDGDG